MIRLYVAAISGYVRRRTLHCLMDRRFRRDVGDINLYISIQKNRIRRYWWVLLRCSHTYKETRHDPISGVASAHCAL